jgi:glycosyltransferase involved in cell wall biosynthesis
MGSRGYTELCPLGELTYGACKLLYLVGQLRLGGLERQLCFLLSMLDQARHQPVVVVWNLDTKEKYYSEIKALKIPIYGFPSRWSSLTKLRIFRSLARRLKPEIIHSYGFHTNFAAHYAARGTNTVAIGSIRSDFGWAKRQGGMLRGTLNARWPYFHISNSQRSAEAMNAYFRLVGPRRVFVVRNGLDLDRFSSHAETTNSKNYVASVGTLSAVKRWDRLLRLIQKLRTFGVEDVEFRVAGDGPLHLTLERMAQDLGISLRAKLIGESHDIPAFLSGAKFLVHTSETEGCPNVVMEAMACGLPVVAMEAGDIPYLVEDGKTGFVVRQGDETTLAERVLQLLREEKLCLSMGLAARSKAEREFKLERLVSETLAVYKEAGWKDQR